MILTQMTADHVPQIAQLEKMCFSDPWSENSIASELNNALSLWYVALEGDRVAGYIGSQTVMGESDIMNVAVHPDYRRAGIAQALILELMEGLRLRRSRCMLLEVRDSNEPARALYEKLGFREIGRRRNYYRNPREDALILKKEWEV